MGWCLKSGDRVVRWWDRRVFGRDDFPDEPALSRKHFEVVERKGRVYVQDLSSTNGTYIYGQRVRLNEAIEIQIGDAIKVGESRFELQAVEDFAPLPLDAALFVVTLLITLAEPSLAWGLSVGATGLALIVGLLFVCFVTAAALSNYVWVRILKRFWNPRTYAAHAASVIGLGLLLNSLSFQFVSRGFGLSEELARGKIEHFCISSFQQARCVEQINLCQECAKNLESWKREVIAQRLKAEREPSSK